MNETIIANSIIAKKTAELYFGDIIGKLCTWHIIFKNNLLTHQHLRNQICPYLNIQYWEYVCLLQIQSWEMQFQSLSLRDHIYWFQCVRINSWEIKQLHHTRNQSWENVHFYVNIYELTTHKSDWINFGTYS